MRAATEVIRRLGSAGRTLALAESCTGGYVGHLLTNVPGSSQAFLGDIVAYHNAAKERLLGVPRGVLEREGAVCPTVAAAMARGALAALAADLALGVTGIAGPGGGTPEKPAGLVYIALAARDGLLEVEERRFAGISRQQYKERVAAAAFSLLLRHLPS